MRIIPTRKKEPNPTGQMPLMDHLAELRRRLIICVAVVTVGMVVVMLPLYDPIIDVLMEPYLETCDPEVDNCTLLQTDPLEGFNVRLRVSMYGGIALAMPVLLWQTWRFISPGLYSNEKRYALPFVASGLALFGLGATLAYWMLPRALGFLGSIGGTNLVQHYSPGKYVSLVSYMMLAFGAGFQVPVLLVFLQLAGVLQTDTLRRFRRYSIVVIAILSAVVTPTGDPQTMLALMLPMYLFYELSILLGGWLTGRRARAPA